MSRSRSPKGDSRLDIVYECRHGEVIGFRVRGHAGFAVTGRDIVCAAASALVLSAAYGLRQHCGVTPVIVDTAGQFRLDVSGRAGAQAQAVLATMVSGLEGIAAAYPGYIRIRQGKLPVTGPRLRAPRIRK